MPKSFVAGAAPIAPKPSQPRRLAHLGKRAAKAARASSKTELQAFRILTKAAALSAKAGDKVSLYDISDGATWANKAELGVIVSRHSPHDHLTELGIRKVNERKGRGSPFALCARLSSFP